MITLQTPWMAALGGALLHSLWQGVVLGILAWGALSLVRRQAASTRYAVAYGALVLQALLVALTFGILLPEKASAPLAWSPGLAPPRAGLDPWLPYASLAWLGGVAILGARLGLGWAWLMRLRVKATEPAEPEWQARLASLARDLGLPAGIRLLRSTLVATPMVVGWLRPVVLVPASAFLGLTPTALEAILAHELAHVRRFDYLFNLVQNVLETLLFYHPATWWLSRQIRAERENAADDLAIALVGEPLRYARALADLETLRTSTFTLHQMAPAATGGNLMNRIRRILLPAPPLPSARAGILTALAVAILGASAAMGFAEDKKPQETRRMVLQEGDRRIDLQLKGDAKLDPKSETGVNLGEDGSIELSVREAPSRKKVTFKKDAKTLTVDGKETPLKGADEVWVRQILGELKGLEVKVEPGKAGTKSYRVEVEEEATKGGKPRIFTYRSGTSSGGSATPHMEFFEGKMRLPAPHMERFYFKSKDGDVKVESLEDGLAWVGKDGKELHLETRVEAGKDGKHKIIIGKPGKHDILEEIEVVKKGAKDGKPIRIETRIEEDKDGKHKVFVTEGSDLTAHKGVGMGYYTIRKGDPKEEAEQIKKQIEKLQKLLKEVEAKAKEQPEKK